MAHRTASITSAHLITFFKLGGTWDMTKNAQGRLAGSGGLDDAALAALEQRLQSETIAAAEKKLAAEMAACVQQTLRQPERVTAILSWVPHAETYVDGPYYALYSGDSSHLRASLIAPLVTTLLHYANDHPERQVLGAQGTDTADATILPLLDAFLFDTELQPILLTGANRSQFEWNSDAPKNFSDLLQLAGAHVPAGGYWVFGSHLYRASDMLKIDPTESRRIENFTTFFAPRLTSQFTKKVIGENALHHQLPNHAVQKTHPITSLTHELLYDAILDIDVVDIGNLNPVQEDVARILDPRKKAAIVCAFALGNGNNQIKRAVKQAAANGKIVVIIDRTLLGVVNGRYEASLFWTNEVALRANPVLSGYRMNQATARALVTRALIEGHNPEATQQLIIRYCESRQLLA